MKNKELVIKKGYTLKVVSWENDGDNYRTESITVETIEEAKKIHKICKELFKSGSNSKSGIGNSMDREGEYQILDYVELNAELFPELELLTDDKIFDYFRDLAYNVMGSSEFYDFRVYESCTVTY